MAVNSSGWPFLRGPFLSIVITSHYVRIVHYWGCCDSLAVDSEIVSPNSFTWLSHHNSTGNNNQNACALQNNIPSYKHSLKTKAHTLLYDSEPTDLAWPPSYGSPSPPVARFRAILTSSGRRIIKLEFESSFSANYLSLISGYLTILNLGVRRWLTLSLRY